MRDVPLDLLSGAVASGVTRFVVGPLDVVKIRFQVQSTSGMQPVQYTSISQAFRQIVRSEGVLALWKGNLSAIGMYVPWGSIQFATFHGARRFFWPNTPTSELSTLQTLTCGSLAGLMCTLATYPLDFLRTRMAVQQNSTPLASPIRAVIKQATADRGVRGLYVGLAPAIVGQLPYTALSFTVYHGLKSKMESSGMQSTTVSLSCGLVAGIASKILTMPLDVIKKRFQTMNYEFRNTTRTPLQHSSPSLKLESATISAATHTKAFASSIHSAASSPHASPSYSSIIDCARTIVRNEGVLALYRGCTLSIMKAAPAAAVNFVAYEHIRKLLAAAGSQSAAVLGDR